MKEEREKKKEGERLHEMKYKTYVSIFQASDIKGVNEKSLKIFLSFLRLKIFMKMQIKRGDLRRKNCSFTNPCLGYCVIKNCAKSF